MRVVSIQDFIDEVFEHDSSPPAGSTVRRLCHEKDEFGQAVIPGAFKMGIPGKLILIAIIELWRQGYQKVSFRMRKKSLGSKR